jgi:hypothetical protein
MSVDVPESSANRHGKARAAPEVISEHASVADMFTEGAEDSSDFPALSRFSDAADDELDEGEPNLDALVVQGKVFRAQLVNMLNEYDSWSSLVRHYNKSRNSGNK